MPHERGSNHLGNVGMIVQDYMALQFRKSVNAMFIIVTLRTWNSTVETKVYIARGGHVSLEYCALFGKACLWLFFFIMLLHYVIAFIYLWVEDASRTKFICPHSVNWDAVFHFYHFVQFSKNICSHTTNRFWFSVINITPRCCRLLLLLFVPEFEN